MRRFLSKAPKLAKYAHEGGYDYDKLAEEFDQFRVIEKDDGFRVSVGIPRELNTALLVIFRGTELVLSNIKADLYSLPTEHGGFTACQDCIVHKGFQKAFMSLKIELLKVIIEYTTPEIKEIIFTGHSLGGAMANFGAYTYINRRENKKEGFTLPDVSLITFGAPRVGNKNFADFMNKPGNLKWNYRVIYGKDPVTGVPFKSWGFVHAGTEIRYNKDDFVTAHKGAPLTDTCDDNTSVFSVGDHTKYNLINSESLWMSIVGSRK